MPEIKHLVTGFHVNTDQGALALCTIVLIQVRRTTWWTWDSREEPTC